jgi:aquaporin Z
MVDAPALGRALVAEAIGTFVLVLLGVGAALMSDGDYVATGLSFGVAMMVLAYALGRLSGAHFNPAITFGATLSGRLSWGRGGLYLLGQLAGALVAGAVLWGLMSGFPGFSSVGNLGQNSFGDAGSGYAWWAALPLEALMTALFVGVVLAVTDARSEHPGMAPLAIGLTLTVVHFASMAATRTSVNPARSIGVGMFAGAEAVLQLWLFILAPLLGAAVAGLAYPLLFGRDAEPVRGSGIGRRRPATVADPAFPPAGVYEPAWNHAPAYPPQWDRPSVPGNPHYRAPEPPAWESEEPFRPPAGLRPIHPSQRKFSSPPEGSTSDPLEGVLAEGFPPGPNEPYWSQQLPREWGDIGDLGEFGDEEDGRTQTRPPGGH